jgi:hypothetical protein
MRSIRLFKYGAVVLLLGLPLLAAAQQPTERWRHLKPEEKESVLRNYQRWRTLPPENKERLREEWDHWQSLPQDRRENLKRRYEELRQLSPGEQKALRERLNKDSRRPKGRDRR